MATAQTNRYLARRPLILGLSKVVALAVAQIPLVQAAPFHASLLISSKEDSGKDPQDPNLWLYLGVAAVLVLLGGAFAGLTIALMGQDEIYLQVIKTSGEGAERKHAAKVLQLLGRGKHWVLVTLLLGNVITNETLPIVLDRSLGGGWPAVLGSTVLIVIFGEIAPQSVCVRYGLPIGSWMAPFVLTLMYILAPIAWPTAKLLDWLLGEDHGTVYKKAGLKTLVSLHKSLGETGQQLNADEVTIISAVLDLKDKSIGSIMTPMDDVFTMSLDDVLDETTMDILLSQGYSRIPIHHPDNDENFVGMLLVKMLITYDPEDAKPVRDFALATLPETRPETSCLDIVNFFQEGKSHMVLVSNHPGEDRGALGVVTLEDVIEELIGEEIIDESDVFIDVHKAIRRTNLAPYRRVPRGQVVNDTVMNGHEPDLIDIAEDGILSGDDLSREKTMDRLLKDKPSPSPGGRRRSSATDSNAGNVRFPSRTQTEQMKEHLKHLGPSNLASRPKATRYNTVKIKPGRGRSPSPEPTGNGRMTMARRISETTTEYHGGIGEGLLVTGGRVASDGVQALQHGYGSLDTGSANGSPTDRRPASATKGIQARPESLDRSSDNERQARPAQRSSARSEESRSRSTIRSLHTRSQHVPSKGPARSGSITENIIDVNGVRKVVLETTSSSSSNEEDNSGAKKGSNVPEKLNSKPSKDGSPSGSKLPGGSGGDEVAGDDSSKKPKRRRRKRGAAYKAEREPLLEGRK